MSGSPDIDPTRLGELLEADRYARHLGIRLVDDASVTVEMTITKIHLNFLGGLHGGALFSLADCALSLASNHDSTAVAIDTHLALTGQAEVGETISARAEEIHRGRRTGTYRITVRRQDERVIGIFTGTVLLV